uniref:Dynein attachment factor N-terminal domain-containing protein n=1 Tax=Glossina austeni TaxID=7395 RepID=A0A1A9URE5_GLOAU
MFPSNLNEKISPEELQSLYRQSVDVLRAAELRALKNDAKLRAVHCTKTYTEFKDIVDAAHLEPITKQDKMNAKTKTHLWNNVAREADM